MKIYAWINRIKKLKVPGRKRNSGPKTVLNGGEEDDYNAGGGGGDVNGVAVAACAKNPTCSGGYGGRGGEVGNVAGEGCSLLSWKILSSTELKGSLKLGNVSV